MMINTALRVLNLILLLLDVITGLQWLPVLQIKAISDANYKLTFIICLLMMINTAQ
jgi:hypothetical protein